tara:strand:- start:248 stop:520 length:273 start_codon:yes stop_codon:yes gene_type:complete
MSDFVISSDDLINEQNPDIKDALAWFKLHDVESYTDDDGGFYVVISRVLHVQLNDDDIHVLISPSEVSYRADLWREFKGKDKKSRKNGKV